MSKPIKLVDLSKLTPEQRDALAQFYKDAQAVAPQVEELKQVVAGVIRGLLAMPQWRILQAPPPEEGVPAEGWHVGAPEIIDDRKGDGL